MNLPQHLPEPERSEKIAYIKQYGSPNVFTQFQPHVTLACDANATALSAAFAQKAPQVQGGWLPAAVALGPTGPCGTVCCLYLCVYNVRCCFKICWLIGRAGAQGQGLGAHSVATR